MTIERLQDLKLGSMSCSNSRLLLDRTMLYLNDLKSINASRLKRLVGFLILSGDSIVAI
jgi:hypothetical protein